MTKDEALALALHALHTKGEHHPQVYEAIYAIQTVLAQPPLPEQRPWVGLTDDDWAKIEDMPDAFDQGVAWAQARLKERNNG